MFFAIIAGLTAKALGSLIARTAAVVGTTSVIKKIVNGNSKTGKEHRK